MELVVAQEQIWRLLVCLQRTAQVGVRGRQEGEVGRNLGGAEPVGAGVGGRGGCS